MLIDVEVCSLVGSLGASNVVIFVVDWQVPSLVAAVEAADDISGGNTDVVSVLWLEVNPVDTWADSDVAIGFAISGVVTA